MKRTTLLLAALALLIGGVGPAQADIITVTSDYQGWVNSTGQGNGAYPGNNTFTGIERGLYFNSWASFALPAFSGHVTAATLNLNLTDWPTGSFAYTVSIFDVSTPQTSFTGGPVGLAVYNDLGSGNLYGSTTSYGPVSITLSPQALTDITAHSGEMFLVGFTNTTLNGQNTDGVDAGFYSNGGSAPQLVAVTAASAPEPSTLTILGMGAAGLIGYGCLGYGRGRRKLPAISM